MGGYPIQDVAEVGERLDAQALTACDEGIEDRGSEASPRGLPGRACAVVWQTPAT